MVNKVPNSSTKSTYKNKSSSETKCYWCGKSSHLANVCRYKDTICYFCRTKGHLEAVCQKKIRTKSATNSYKNDKVKHIESVHTISQVPKLEIPLYIQSKLVSLELDTATSGNFFSEKLWSDLGKPKLSQSELRYRSASKHNLSIAGTFEAITTLSQDGEESAITFNVSKIKDLNLLGCCCGVSAIPFVLR